MNGSLKVLIGLGAYLVVTGLAGSLPHMVEWTTEATEQGLWFGLVNASISEILPFASFLAMKLRRDSARSTSFAIGVFLFALALSIAAQLSSTGWRFPYQAQFLACLPAIAVVILSIIVHGELEHLKEERMKTATAAERARNELATRQRNEQAAAEERARRERADTAERAAEVARNEALAEQARADAARAQAEQIAAQAQLAAEQLAAERAEQGRRLLEDQRAELARRQADAAIRAEQAKKGAAPLPRTDEATAAKTPRPSAAQTAALVKAALDQLPTGTTRAEAVKAVAAELQMTTKGVRNHVPEDWCASAQRRLHAVKSATG